jgi:uncharacterized protein (DUF302 family)
MTDAPMVEGYSTVLPLSMPEAEARVREALTEQGFGVLTEIDVAATLKAKIGVERPPLKILGACNPVLANAVIERDDSVALLLPCNVVLDAVDDGTRVRAIDPLGMLAADDLDDLAGDAGRRLQTAIESL